MALIVCPECGKELSDMAVACPNCGCPMSYIKQSLAEKELHERTSKIDYEVDGDTRYCKACLNCGAINWNVNADGYRGGYCIECREAKLYDKLVKIDYLTSDFTQYTGAPPKLIGAIKADKYAALSEEWRQRVYTKERELFEKFVSGWDTIDKNCRPYKLNMETLYSNSKGEAHSEIKREAAQYAAKIAAQKPVYYPKCPNCGSPSVKRISDTNKGVSFALFGVFSSKFGKQYECNNCGYYW